MVNWRAVVFWFVGTICVFFGALIAGNIDPSVLGATTFSVALAYIISFVLVLIGGVFWISTAIAHLEES